MVKPVWIASDGTMFESLLDAELYEAKQQQMSVLKGEMEEFIGFSKLSDNLLRYEGNGSCDYDRVSMHDFAADILVEFVQSLPEELEHGIYHHLGIL